MPLTLREVLQRLQAAVAGIGPPLDSHPFSGSVRISCPSEGGFTVLIDTRDAPRSIAEALANNSSPPKKTTVQQQQQHPACVVCLDTAEELAKSEDRLVSGKCGHLHCTHCADRINKSFSNKCSVCRNSLGSIRPLFW